MDKLEPKIQKILNKNPSLKLINDNTKVKCNLSGHEMPCRLTDIQMYISGKRYNYLARKTSPGFDPSKYEQHLVPNKNPRKKNNMLFCNLTMSNVNKGLHHIERHVMGRRFQNALAKWDECQITGEQFRPNISNQKKDKNKNTDKKKGEASWQDDDDEQHSGSGDDDLTDLYPPGDFEDSDDEDMDKSYEIVDEPSKKRKSEEEVTVKKKKRKDMKPKK